MTYGSLGPGALDYLPCRYGKSKLLFRGPKRRLDAPFIAFIGGAETYGKFIRTPFPAMTETELGVNCVNFGIPNAGVDVFLNDAMISHAVDQSRATVVQVLGAQNLSNRFYSVHPRRNDRIVAASPMVRTIYRDVDFTEFHFTKHMLNCLHVVSVERFATVRQELQAAWVARMRLLLERVNGKTVLLWMADRPPPLEADMGFHPTKSMDPLFVTREMLDALSSYATEFVEVTATADAMACAADDMYFSDLEAPTVKGVLGPKTHADAADALAKTLARML
ncbi:MAG: DUF6473 family protein [Sulfitobacter sp.]